LELAPNPQVAVSGIGPVTVNVPALTAVGPKYELAPDSVKVPPPFLLRGPGPLIGLLMLIDRPGSTSKTPPLAPKTTSASEGIKAEVENWSVPPSKFKALVLPRDP